MKQTRAKNPILSGFYPDPSICRTGKDFYLVTSSFACFPGVPIFKSRDLAHWEQVGNILNRNSQIPLKECGQSEGIYAPTLRYYNGLYYMITTNVSAARSTGDPKLGSGNFIVTAERPEGPWSEPYFLGEAAQGIDPSLFFDEDGSCYYCGTRPNSGGVKYNGDWEIWVQKLDLDTMKLTGESKAVWNGAMRNVIWPEGPHIYKINGWYYLLHAEGGTGPDHCVAVARSRQIMGPYTGYPSNPILTHRHLGKEYPIRYVGHADLVNVPAEMTLSGEEKWYMVCLASRPYQGHTMLGRETFLAEVVWEDGWPVVNPGKGKLTKEAVIDLPESEIGEQDSSITFHCDKLPDKMLMLRNPGGDAYSLQAHKGCLRLPLKNSSLKSYESPAFAGVRQTAFYFEASTAFQFFPENETEAAGLVIFQSNQFHLKLQIVKRKEYAVAQAVFVKALTADGMINGDVKKLPVTEELLFEEKICKIKESNCYRIRISCDGIKVSAFADSDDSGIMEKRFAKKIPIEALSTEAAGGFVGNLIGLFAESEEQESRNHADFLFFDIL